jgi:hypothetical protein
MKYSLSLLFLLTLVVTSCKNDETAANQTDPRFVVPFTQQTAVAANNATTAPTVSNGNHNLFHQSNAVQPTTVLGGINPAHGQPNHRCDIAVGAPLNSASNSAAPVQKSNLPTQQAVTTSSGNIVTSSGINPPHGEKNHRCDIAVGAPLNSKAPTSAATANYVVNQPTKSTASKTTTATGMNPPHGEKNHRCDIAVGAALNSKSVAAAPASSGQVSQQISVQPALPTLLSTTTADTETPSGMNPAHGKDGHRCDIAVGAPLPKS